MNNKKSTLAIIGILLLMIPSLFYLITSVMEFSGKVVLGSNGIFSFDAWRIISLVNNILSFLGFAFLLAYFTQGSGSEKAKPQAPVMPQQYQQPVQQQYQQPVQQQYQQPVQQQFQQPAQQQYQQPAQQQFQQPTQQQFQPNI